VENISLLRSAQSKLEMFLQSAATPEFQSEARGWLARIHFLLGDQTAAGKMYLDELNRNGSNLSRNSLLDSLYLTYGHDGGPQLAADIDQYFDTAEHAAFAVQMLTNPRNIDLYVRRVRTVQARHGFASKSYSKLTGHCCPVGTVAMPSRYSLCEPLCGWATLRPASKSLP
jgi:hypothetical protein